MRGRKPKPTNLQILHGNPRKHGKGVIEAKRAIEPKDDRIEPPDDFSDSERIIWGDAIASAPPGILRRIDVQILAAWTVACDLHRRARVAQRRTSLLMQVPQKEGGKAIPQISPLISIINRQAAVMIKAAEQLGFTPTSRPRIYAGSPLPVATEAIAAASRPDRDRAPSLDDYLASAPALPTIN